EVLGTNYIPSLEEVLHLRSLVLKPEERIRQLDEEISRLQVERDKLQRFVDRHRALSAPVRRLPPDIWRMIFARCLPDTDIELCMPPLSTEAPLLLTTICRSWREIATTTPQLWSSLHIYLPVPTRGLTGERFFVAMEERKRGLELWLSRSGAVPLAVFLSNWRSLVGWPRHPISLDQRDLQEELKALDEEFIQFVTQHSRRLRSLTIGNGMSGEILNEHLAGEDLPLLEHIRAFTTIPTRLINHAPALRKLDIKNKLYHYQFFTNTLSSVEWSRLTHFRIGGALTVAFVREAATYCTSIVSLIFDHNRWNGPHNPDSDGSDSGGGSIQRRTASPIVCQSLRNLTVSFNAHETIVNSQASREDNQQSRDFNPLIRVIFESIQTPGLTSLEVNIRDSDPDGHRAYQLATQSTPFEGFLSRSCCQVTRLKIDLPRTLSVEALSRSLRLLESLQFLIIGSKSCQGDSGDLYSSRARGWCSQLFRVLALPRESQPEDLVERQESVERESGSLCPELTAIEVEGCFADEATAIIDFAISRPKLKILKADFGIPLAEEVSLLLATQEAIQMMREEKGLHVSWTWTEYDHKKAPLFSRRPRRKFPVSGWW
ncbi:hypothetical protein V5O48_017434, partial [Marasmius crinis-equi]